jgi:MFS family permease
MQNIGQAWLVLKLTNSPFRLGIITMLQTLPVLALSLFVGVFVDRFPKRKLVMLAQTGLMLIAFTLSILTLSGSVRYWHVAVLATLLGVLNTIDNPSRQSLMIELVGKDDLMNAIALNSSIFNLARIIGPAIAGILIGYIDIGLCFLINGISYLAVLAGLFMMDIREENTVSRKAGILKEMKEGLAYVYKTPKIYTPLLLMLFINVFAMNFNVLVPVYTKLELNMSASHYGILMAAMGIGALAGALTLAARSRTGPSFKWLFAGAAGLSFFQGLIGLTNAYYLALVLMAITGFCMIIFTATCNTTLQINSDDHIRGRVMSLYALVFLGMTTFGSLITGSVSEYLGAAHTFILSGLIGLMACGVIYRRLS